MPSDSAAGSTATKGTRSAGSQALQLLLHRLVLRPLISAAFGVDTDGRERLRDLEQYILVANHNSHLDLPLLFQLLPVDRIARTHPLAAYEYFARSRLLFRTVERLFRPVWLARPGHDGPTEGARAGDGDGEAVRAPAGDDVSVEGALAAMARHLGSGRSVVIFPEGTRGVPGWIAPFKRGVGRLALAFPGVPVVPVYLSGPERALPRTSGVPLPLWTRAQVGEPLWPARALASPEEIAAELEGAVRTMAEAEQGRRHRRYVRPGPGPTVAVLGIDGSGKSTLAHGLGERLSATGRVAVVSDELAFFEEGEGNALRPPVTELLRRALNRRVKRAKSLKSYKLPKMAELFLRDAVTRHVRRWQRPRATVLDGCPALNMAAWARIYRSDVDDPACAAALRVLIGTEPQPGRGDPIVQRFPELLHLSRLRLTPMERPDAVFFLDVPPAVALERIRSRGETRQVHETEEKLARLRDGYLAVCRVIEPAVGVPARVLDGTRSPEQLVVSAMGELRTLLRSEPAGESAERAGPLPQRPDEDRLSGGGHG